MFELILLMIAMTLLYTILPIVSLYAVCKRIHKKNHSHLKVWFYGTARQIDLFGNVIAADLFNDVLIKKTGYQFGKRGETISSVLGKNIKTATLTRAGKLLVIILDFIEKNHCINSIND